MKEQIEKIIDELADKSLTFGCEFSSYLKRYMLVETPKEGIHGIARCIDLTDPHPDGISHVKIIGCKNEGHPVRIGDVLEHLTVFDHEENSDKCVTKELLAEFVIVWKLCGAAKSLQEIFDCEWKEHAVYQGPDAPPEIDLLPKDPNIRALAELLIKLFPDG